jgi:hypothetical protein
MSASTTRNNALKIANLPLSSRNCWAYLENIMANDALEMKTCKKLLTMGGGKGLMGRRATENK